MIAGRSRAGLITAKGARDKVTSESVILYTTPECDVCDRARADMQAEGIAFEERNVMKNKEWFNEVLKHTIFVPLVVRGEQIEIGWKGAVG